MFVYKQRGSVPGISMLERENIPNPDVHYNRSVLVRDFSKYLSVFQFPSCYERVFE